MPRMTIDLDDAVLKALKARAERERIALHDLIARLLSESAEKKPKFTWISRDLGAKIDMSDWSVVKEFLSREEDDALGYRH